MRAILILIVVFLTCPACSAGTKASSSSTDPVKESGFCGKSTQGNCKADSDCKALGCSGHICQSVSEPDIISTCEYRDCYDAAKHGMKCGCVQQACRWRQN